MNQRFTAVPKVVATLVALLSLVGPARAQDEVAAFYKDKQIRMLVGSAAGSGYDIGARLMARFLTQYIPGNPTFIVRNMPGSGSIAAVSFLSKIAPRDGTAIGCVQNNAAFEPLFGTKEADYDPMKLTYLGGPALEIGTLITWHQSRAKTLEDARRHEVTVGASGANSTMVGNYLTTRGWSAAKDHEMIADLGLKVACESPATGAAIA